MIIDLFNEPEWLLLDSDITIPSGKRPPEIREGGIVALATMTSCLSEMIELYRQKGLDGKPLLTIGSASPGWVRLWDDLDIDIAQFHLWNGPGQIDEGLTLNFAPPIDRMPTFVGECSDAKDLSNSAQVGSLRRSFSAFPVDDRFWTQAQQASKLGLAAHAQAVRCAPADAPPPSSTVSSKAPNATASTPSFSCATCSCTHPNKEIHRLLPDQWKTHLLPEATTPFKL